MTIAVYKGEATILSVGVTSTVAPIGQCNTITFGPIEQAPVDTFSLDSTIKTSRPSGLLSPGSVNVNLYFAGTDTTHKLLRTSAMNGAILFWKIATTDGASYTFQGYV